MHINIHFNYTLKTGISQWEMRKIHYNVGEIRAAAEKNTGHAGGVVSLSAVRARIVRESQDIVRGYVVEPGKKDRLFAADVRLSGFDFAVLLLGSLNDLGDFALTEITILPQISDSVHDTAPDGFYYILHIKTKVCCILHLST